jgi:ATP-dependent exoDNAse (exonuclease V) alpha subunit
MRVAGRLGEQELVVGDELAFAVSDRIVTRQNDRRLGVVNGSRGDVTAIGDDASLIVRLDGGDTVTLPTEYVTGRRGYQPFVEHGYALTAHALQGGTVDRTFVLGSEELYREWGYVAFSRHRMETRFYVTSPDWRDDDRPTAAGDPSPRAIARQAPGRRHRAW